MEIKPKTTVTSADLYGLTSYYPFRLINQISTARDVNQWSLATLIFYIIVGGNNSLFALYYRITRNYCPCKYRNYREFLFPLTTS